MNEYFVRTFYDSMNIASDPRDRQIERWLRTSEKVGYGTSIVGFTELTSGVCIVVKRWKLRDMNSIPATRTTIDELPQEPSINYPEDETPNIDLI